MKSPNSQKVIESLLALPDHLSQAWQEGQLLNVKKLSGAKFKNIICCGMGGSNLAMELVRSVYGNQLKIPVILVRNYHLPAFAGQDSLIIISSYSGTTEETISCLQEARAKKLKIFCLSTGGEIVSQAKRYKLPYYLLDAKSNPSGQPRYGIGLQIGILIALLNKLKIIKVATREIDALSANLKNLNFSYWRKNGEANPATNLAAQLANKSIIIVAAQFLSANAHILANQINESAKNLAHPYLLPELNHHLLEGLALPRTVSKATKFLFLNSSSYENNINKRVAVTQKVLARQKIAFVNHFTSATSRLTAALEILLFGSWVSYYLSELNGADPTAIPWVNFFKAELKK
jgi:glucose/mannose-6-phosphate isomerase